jgi:hypothetical protein
MADKETHVVMAVITDRNDVIMKSLETFTTIAAGLAMDGIEISISTHTYDYNSDEEHVND